MILIGPAVALPAVALNLEAIINGSEADLERLLGPLLVVALGGLLFIVGLVLNAVRAVIVRGGLSAERYRGPAIFVLLLLVLIVGNIVALGAGGEVIALVTGGQLTVGGSLVLLTATQVGMLTVVGGLVVAPRALAGLRLAPRGRVGRGILIGLGLAIPAWIGTTLLSLLVTLVLQAVGIDQQPGIVDEAVRQVDPTVLIVALLVVAPIAEELFFRGVVFNAWERERGPRVALYGSAALFAAIHDAVSAAPIFFLGLFLAHVYRTTRSLPTTIAVHAGFNGISLTLAFLVRLGVLDLPV
jgi:membrane protease YdiL (CAAX protease family)